MKTKHFRMRLCFLAVLYGFFSLTLMTGCMDPSNPKKKPPVSDGNSKRLENDSLILANVQPYQINKTQAEEEIARFMAHNNNANTGGAATSFLFPDYHSLPPEMIDYLYLEGENNLVTIVWAEDSLDSLKMLIKLEPFTRDSTNIPKIDTSGVKYYFAPPRCPPNCNR